MTQVRIYTLEKIFKESTIKLSDKNLHYLNNVMRKKVGDQINIFNENSGEWNTTIIGINKFIIVKVNKLVRKPEVQKDIWLFFGMTKSRKVKLLVEKVTEIGVTRIIPIDTEFSERIKINTKKMKKIAIEAVEQSNQINPPIIELNVKLEKLVKNFKDNRVKLLCDENLESPNILDFLSENKTQKLAIFIGPVGGWSEKDHFFLTKLNNLYSVSLGSSVFKIDTASIFSVACCNLLMDS